MTPPPDTAALLAILREPLGTPLRATREGGRQTLAETLAARTGEGMAQALAWVDALAAQGLLRFVPATSDAEMLHVARYGTAATAPPDEGEWRLSG